MDYNIKLRPVRKVGKMTAEDIANISDVKMRTEAIKTFAKIHAKDAFRRGVIGASLHLELIQ